MHADKNNTGMPGVLVLLIGVYLRASAVPFLLQGANG
jgi:hypothetical protein